MPYSTIDDLLLGDIPLSRSLNREKFIADASDEVDSYIGALYVTPVAEEGLARHSLLLLKRINNFLATGRLILAIDAGGEDTALHAYGLRLVQEALGALNQIASGAVDLEGATPQPVTNINNAPSITNLDAASPVEAFYRRVMVPESDIQSGLPYRDWAPGSDPKGSTV